MSLTNTFAYLTYLFNFEINRNPCGMATVRVLPADLRLQLYTETFRLRRENGWGYRRIARALSESHGIIVPKGTVSNWILGVHNPSRRLHRHFTPFPSPELAYVIGAVLGDGYTTRDQGRHIVGFTNKDLNLLKNFQRALSVVLGTPSVGRITTGTRYGTMKVTVSCTLLAHFLERSIRELSPFIENHAAHFLRGFFDAEGSAAVSISQEKLQIFVTASNSNLEILRYASMLLEKRFKIMSPISLAKVGGTYVIRGEPVRFRKPVYRLCINRIRDVETYAMLIGFASVAKDRRLEQCIELLGKYGRKEAARMWLRDHHKERSRWVANW